MKLLKISMALVLSFGMVLSMTACSSQDAAKEPGANTSADGTKEEDTAPPAQKSDKKYTIATDTTFAPFEFQDASGNFVGIDIDLVKAIAQDQNFDIEIQSLGFTAAVQAVDAGQADAVIAGMSITDERKLKFDFSEAYFDSGVVMGIAKDNEEIKSYEDLKGKKVAVKTGTEGADFAESIKTEYDFETVYFDDSNAMYQAVISKNTVACFEDYPVIGYAISQDLGLKIVTEKEQGSSYGFAVKKGENAELLDMFNKGFQNLKANGKYQEILDTYIQE